MRRTARRGVGAGLSLLIGLVVSVHPSAAPQEGASRTQQGRRRAPIVAELSDLLAHPPLTGCGGPTGPADAPRRLRVATWNIRAARSAPVDAIADELRAVQADIVALQEVDVRTRRGGFVDQPLALATALGVQHAFAASIKWDGGDYGLAVLSRWPLTDVRRHRLEFTPGAEPRIVLEVTVCAGGRPLRLFNHHADRRIASRALGFAGLKRLLQAEVGRRILLAGDLNEYADGPGVRSLIDAGLVDLGAGPGQSTNSGRVDYLLADGPLARLASPGRLWPTDKSDHHAVVVDLDW
jgi:endonuclease/exonuclease/phosphatase family metal-dependent hydrolase